MIHYKDNQHIALVFYHQEIAPILTRIFKYEKMRLNSKRKIFYIRKIQLEIEILESTFIKHKEKKTIF